MSLLPSTPAGSVAASPLGSRLPAYLSVPSPVSLIHSYRPSQIYTANGVDPNAGQQGVTPAGAEGEEAEQQEEFVEEAIADDDDGNSP